MEQPATRLHTVGLIAELLDTPLHRVEYVLRSQDIAPLAWAGNARVYSEAAVEQIAAHLKRSEQLADTDHSTVQGGGTRHGR